MREKRIEIESGFEFYDGPYQTPVSASSKLYLVPTTHGENFDPEFSPSPSRLSELPDGERWTQAYIVSVVEILSGRRPVSQVSRTTHRFIYNNLLKHVGSLSELPRIKKIHRCEPIDGVIETTVTLSFKNRVRVLVARFEGVDKKWLCTEFELL